VQSITLCLLPSRPVDLRRGHENGPTFVCTGDNELRREIPSIPASKKIGSLSHNPQADAVSQPVFVEQEGDAGGRDCADDALAAVRG
jgi:hypothetical protein